MWANGSAAYPRRPLEKSARAAPGSTGSLPPFMSNKLVTVAAQGWLRGQSPPFAQDRLGDRSCEDSPTLPFTKVAIT